MPVQNRTRLPSLSIPISTFDDFPDHYSDGFAETPEYEIAQLNLGAETPESVLLAVEDEDAPTTDSWARSGFAVHTSVPTRPRTWRSSSFSRKKSRDLKKQVVDRDCGICFEASVVPSRTSCCGAIFCYEHLSDWLYGSSSDGRCPSCQAPCTLDSTTLLPSSSPSPSTTRPRTYMASLSLPPSRDGTEPEPWSSGYRQRIKPPPSPLRISSRPATPSSSSSSSPSSPSLSLSVSDSSPPTSAEPSNDGDEDKSRVRLGSDKLHPHGCPQDPDTPGTGLVSDSDTYLQSAMLHADIQDAEMSPWETNVSKSTGESLSRVTSAVGLSLFLYFLLASR